MPRKKSQKTKSAISIEPPKGRPMLYWVGKKPLEYVKGFPAQLTEIFDPANSGLRHEKPLFKNLEKNWQNLLFHGDNKEVLATLLENGFRGKVDLIYIDPPFNTGVDYVRKVTLRGVKSEKLEGGGYSIQEQTMYFNNFADDAYLQWMYERLQLLNELLSETGSIFVRMDYHFGHYIKTIIDEIFGKENFRNEIVLRRGYVPKGQTDQLFTANDSLYFYTKGAAKLYENTKPLPEEARQWISLDMPGERKDPSIRPRIFLGQKLFPPKGQHWGLSQERISDLEKQDDIRINKGKTYIDTRGKKVTGMPEYKKEPFLLLNTNWTDIESYTTHNTFYPTENSEELLERVIKLASKDGNIVLDCFIGSGTTARVAQKLERRWIGCDINKGAIQTTSKELQKIILERKKEDKAKYPSFAIYQVNDYDLKLLHTEAIELAVEHIGIERRKTDSFFDGLLGRELVKVIDFNHPLTLLDLQLIEDEMKKRPEEERNIVVVCLGKELAADPWIETWNKKHPVNKIRVIELRTDKKYGKFLLHQPASAKVKIERKGSKAVIDIIDFNSPAIIERLNDPNSVFKVKIPDFRAMIDVALIDTNYNGKTFRIVYSDVPEKKSDYIAGHYKLEILKGKTKLAVKIVDMLGEEVIITKEV